MADQKISQLSDGGASQATDEYVIARSGANYRIDGASIAAAATSVGTLSSLTVSGDVTVDTSTLKVDSVNNRVGIGTSSPTYKLDVAGSARLTNAEFIYFNNASGTAKTVLGYFSDNNTYLDASDGALKFRTGTGPNERATIDASGNLGLGVTPSAWNTYRALDISGGGAFISANNAAEIWSNAFFDGAVKYKANGFATRYHGNTSGAHAWYIAGNNTSGAGAALTFTQAMTLAASGNLLLGLTSDAAGFRFSTNAGASSNGHLIAGSGTGIYSNWSDGTSTDSPQVGGIGNALVFRTSSTERARITSGGYFKASNTGTYNNSTASYHELYSTADAPSVVVKATQANYTSAIVYADAVRAASSAYKFYTSYANNVEQFYVRGDGVIYAQNTTVQSISDARLKDNVVDAAEGLAIITALRPVRFDWKAGYGNDRKNQLGFIAQEVEAVFPEAVSEWVMDEPTGEVDEDGKPITEKVDYKTVGPGALIPVLVKAIQEQQAMISSLEARLAALES